MATADMNDEAEAAARRIVGMTAVDASRELFEITRRDPALGERVMEYVTLLGRVAPAGDTEGDENGDENGNGSEEGYGAAYVTPPAATTHDPLMYYQVADTGAISRGYVEQGLYGSLANDVEADAAAFLAQGFTDPTQWGAARQFSDVLPQDAESVAAARNLFQANFEQSMQFQKDRYNVTHQPDGLQYRAWHPNRDLGSAPSYDPNAGQNTSTVGELYRMHARETDPAEEATTTTTTATAA